MLGHKYPENYRELLEEIYNKPYKECTLDEREIRRTRSKSAAARLADRILRRVADGDTDHPWPVAADFHAVGPDFRPDQEKPHVTLKRWYKNRLFKAQVMDEMRKKLDDRGLNEDTALDMLAESVKMAREEGSINERNSTFDRLDKLLGLSKKSTVTEEVGFDYTRHVGGEEKGRITAKRTRQIDDAEIKEIEE